MLKRMSKGNCIKFNKVELSFISAMIDAHQFAYDLSPEDAFEVTTAANMLKKILDFHANDDRAGNYNPNIELSLADAARKVRQKHEKHFYPKSANLRRS